LPIVGCVHKASATGGVLEELGLEASTTCSGPEEIADWLGRVARSVHWAEQSAKSRNAFELLRRQEEPAQKLKRALDNIA